MPYCSTILLPCEVKAAWPCSYNAMPELTSSTTSNADVCCFCFGWLCTESSMAYFKTVLPSRPSGCYTCTLKALAPGVMWLCETSCFHVKESKFLVFTVSGKNLSVSQEHCAQASTMKRTQNLSFKHRNHHFWGLIHEFLMLEVGNTGILAVRVRGKWKWTSEVRAAVTFGFLV